MSPIQCILVHRRVAEIKLSTVGVVVGWFLPHLHVLMDDTTILTSKDNISNLFTKLVEIIALCQMNSRSNIFFVSLAEEKKS